MVVTHKQRTSQLSNPLSNGKCEGRCTHHYDINQPQEGTPSLVCDEIVASGDVQSIDLSGTYMNCYLKFLLTALY